MGDKPSVLVVLPSLQPARSGEYLEEIGENFIALVKSYAITVAALKRPNETGEFDREGVHVLTMQRKDEESFGAGELLRWMRRIIAIHKERRFQIVHSVWATYTSFLGMMVSYTLGIPSLVSVAGGECQYMPNIQYGGAGTLAHRIRLRWVLHHATALSAGSEIQKKIVGQFYPPAEKKTSLAPFGIRGELFPFKLRPAPSSEIVILAVGWLNTIKNYPLLLRAFAIVHRQFPQAILNICGEGTEEMNLCALTRDLQISGSVFFLGKISHFTLAEQYQNAHLFVHTSRFESQCFAIIEALSTGLPVVSTPVGIAPETLNGKNGAIVKFFDENHVAKELICMITRIQSSEYEEMQRKAYASSERFEVLRTTNAFVSVYDELLHK